jgi:type IV secretory pathway VirB10-like protein
MQKDNPEERAGEPIDPHSSKIPADDPRLQLPKKKGRTLKKGPAVAISATLMGVVSLAVALALQPQNRSAKQEKDDQERETVAQPTIPDVIRQAPDERMPVSFPDTSITASGAEDAPMLGRPLPGDLGHAMVSSSGGYQSTVPDPVEQERLAAVSSSPFFGGASTAPAASLQGSSVAGLQAPALAAGNAGTYGRDQNNQARKNDFFENGGGEGKDYLSRPMRNAVSRYEVKAGAIIPAILVTGVTSDLPGNIIAMVKENVYDTVSGEYLLVPQGTRVLGKYDSMVSYGQKRVQVAWTRLIRPDGSSIMLENMPGVDLAGNSGYRDKVDNHFDRLVGGALLSSVLSVGATVSQGTYTDDASMTTQQRMAASVGQNINSAGQQITRKNLDIQPTLKIRAGMSVNILVNKDMIVEPYNN